MNNGYQISLINEIGQRTTLEDYCWFGEFSTYALFIVCDGVGASDYGEIASKLVCENIAAFSAESIDNLPDDAAIQNAIGYTEQALDKFVSLHPESRGMATTFTALYLAGNKATIAHAGDSRVYQVRNGNILFQTLDHKYVNELVATGYITAEQAITHPKRNMITRAITGTLQPTLAEVAFINEIKTGDYFILCTDGLLEAIDDNFIAKEFTAEAKPGQLTTAVKNLCSEHATDNFSGIFIKIDTQP